MFNCLGAGGGRRVGHAASRAGARKSRNVILTATTTFRCFTTNFPSFSLSFPLSAFQVRSPSSLASPTSVTCSSCTIISMPPPPPPPSVPATACTSSQREPPPPPPPSSENRAAMLTTKTATMTESTLRMMRMRTTMTTAIEIFASSKTGKPRSGELRRRDIQREKETQPRVFIFIRFKSYFVR